jgi:hypothetical protein
MPDRRRPRSSSKPEPIFERRGVVVPFLVHQLLDYLAGLYLLQAGSRSHGRTAAVFYGMGAVLLVAAIFSGKPLGGGRLSRSAHRFVDAAMIALVAAAPFVFGLTDAKPTVVRFEGLAVLLILVVKYTNYVRPDRGATARALKEQGPRLAGQIVGRRLAPKRRPPAGPSS